MAVDIKQEERTSTFLRKLVDIDRNIKAKSDQVAIDNSKFDRLSSLPLLIRTTAYILCFVNNCRKTIEIRQVFNFKQSSQLGYIQKKLKVRNYVC